MMKEGMIFTMSENSESLSSRTFKINAYQWLHKKLVKRISMFSLMLWKLGYQSIFIYGAHFTRVGEVQHVLQANQNIINETHAQY